MTLPGLGRLRAARDRRVQRRLLREADGIDGEEDVLADGQVHHHWIVYTGPALEGLLGLLTASLILVSAMDVAWVWGVLGAGIVGHAAMRALQHYMDVFVITNLRVFRISGLGPTKYATTPLSRILDITVVQTVLGQTLGYGHFTFESAAQEQGLRDIKFVSRPLDRDRMIQRQQLRLLRSQRSDRRP